MSVELREQFADLAHVIWAHWTRYQFGVCQRNEDGSLTIPADKVQRWTRQMETPYAELPDKERESDRHQADKMIALFTGTISTLRQRAEAAERALGRVQDYATYYAIAWEKFEANSDGPEPLDFGEWLAEQKAVQP